MLKEQIVGMKNKISNAKSIEELELLIEESKNINVSQKTFQVSIEEGKKNIDIEILKKYIIELDIPKVGPKTAENIANYFKNVATFLHFVEQNNVNGPLSFVSGVSTKLIEEIEAKVLDMGVLMMLYQLKEESISQKIYNIKSENLTPEQILESFTTKPKQTIGIKGLNIFIDIDVDSSNLSEEEKETNLKIKEDLESFILEKGGNIHNIVLTSTNYLVEANPNKTKGSLEYAKAITYGVNTIGVDELKDLSNSTLKIN